MAAHAVKCLFNLFVEITFVDCCVMISMQSSNDWTEECGLFKFILLSDRFEHPNLGWGRQEYKGNSGGEKWSGAGGFCKSKGRESSHLLLVVFSFNVFASSSLFRCHGHGAVRGKLNPQAWIVIMSKVLNHIYFRELLLLAWLLCVYILSPVQIMQNGKPATHQRVFHLSPARRTVERLHMRAVLMMKMRFLQAKMFLKWDKHRDRMLVSDLRSHSGYNYVLRSYYTGVVLLGMLS